MISIVSLIYRSPKYADWTYESLLANTEELTDGRAEFHFVANNPTSQLLGHLEDRGYSHQVCLTPLRSEEELAIMDIAPPAYLHSVYRAWNHAITESAGEWVVLVNSDMVFSPGWLTSLMREARTDRVAVSQLAERLHPTFGVFPGAMRAELGESPGHFDYEGWRVFRAAAGSEIRRSGTRLAKGSGYMPLAIRRDVAIAAGLYPEGNVGRRRTGMGAAVSGDKYFFDKLAERGVEHVTVRDSLVYHFKEGEMDE